MIDIHTHVLAGVDDGPSGIEVTSAMLAMAAADGITEIVATPHANLEFRFDALSCQAELRCVRARCFEAPSLYLGCEVHLTPENLHAALYDPGRFTLNGKDCLLVELPDIITPQAVDPSLRILVESGLRPIIAHAERNLYIQRHLTYASHLVSLGCSLQLTASSFFGAFGTAAEQTARYIMTQRIGHFVASDAHGLDQRRPLLSKAYAHVSGNYGEATARLLFFDNPGAAIAGAPISTMSPSRCSRLASFFMGKNSAKWIEKQSNGLLVQHD
jgi:protein-tyrosine phosphatase